MEDQGVTPLSIYPTVEFVAFFAVFGLAMLSTLGYAVYASWTHPARRTPRLSHADSNLSAAPRANGVRIERNSASDELEEDESGVGRGARTLNLLELSNTSLMRSHNKTEPHRSSVSSSNPPAFQGNRTVQ